MKLIDNKKTCKPYDREFKNHEMKCKSVVDGMTNYSFSATITGDTEKRAIYLTTGYPDSGDEYDNNFILSIDDLMKLKEMISQVEDEYNSDLTCICKINDCYTELYKYIDAGIVDYIVAEKVGDKYPNYHDELYIPFKITPKFVSDLSSRDLDMTVNLGFNFVDCFHIIPTEKSLIDFCLKVTKTGSINIKFIGYDIEKEMDNYKKKVLKELDEYNPKNRRRYTEEEVKQFKKLLEDGRRRKKNDPV